MSIDLNIGVIKKKYTMILYKKVHNILELDERTIATSY